MKKMLVAILFICICFLLPSGICMAEETTSPVLPDVPNAEQQYQLLMEQHEKWEFKGSDYSPWWYTFTDLDHNGRMEVIVNSIPGSMHLTYSHCYEVNESLNGITSCLSEDQNNDIFQIQRELPCYYDASSDLYFYINEHSFNISGAMHQQIMTDAITLHNGYLESFRLRYKEAKYDNYGESNEVLTLLLKDGDGNIITEDEYNTLIDRRFAVMKKSTLPLTWEKGWHNWGEVLSEPTPYPEVNIPNFRPEDILGPDGFALYEGQKLPEGAVAEPIVVTKNPTSETVAIGGKTWFIAHADNALGICWRFVSPEGPVYTLADTWSLYPGIELEALENDTLAVGNVPESFNGWGIKAAFYGPNTVVESSVAYIYVEGVALPRNITTSVPKTYVSDEPLHEDEFLNCYTSVIDRYRSAMQGKLGTIEAAKEYDVSEWIAEFYPIGYAMMDLDNNGTPELLISGFGPPYNYIPVLLEVCTLENGNPVRILISKLKSRYYLQSDNRIYHEGYGGYDDTVFEFFQVKGNHLEFIEGARTTNDSDNSGKMLYHSSVWNKSIDEQLTYDYGEKSAPEPHGDYNHPDSSQPMGEDERLLVSEIGRSKNVLPKLTTIS
jgi:hypothetical protein